MKKNLCFFLSFFILILISFACLGEELWKEEIIGEGEKWETKGYVQSSDNSGFKVFIIGGIHGNEPAGFLAAEELLSEIKIQNGKVIIIPRANQKAINSDRRFPEGSQDLNRSFGKSSSTNWTESLAKEIFDFLGKFDVDIIIDLHESKDFYREDPKSVGQTIIYNGQGEKIIMFMELIETINEQLPPVQAFSLLSPSYPGSLTRFAYEELGIISIIVETTTKLPLEERIDQQKKIVLTTLNLLGLENGSDNK